MKFCPECGAKIKNETYCPGCGIDLTRFLAPNEMPEGREMTPRERRERILADFEVKDHAIVRYLGKGGRVIIPEGINAIRENAFYRCGVVNEVILPASVREIGDRAFYDCVGLDKITLSEDLEAIGEQAFEGCAFAGKITFPEKLKVIGAGAFESCFALEEAHIPASVKSIGSAAFSSCKKLREIQVEKGSETYSSADGVLFDKAGETLLCYPAGKEETVYRVPDKVKRIGETAFYENENLETIFIGRRAVSIQPTSLLMMKALKRIKVSPFNPEYAEERGVLYRKDKTALLCVPPAYKESVLDVPYAVTEIADNAAVSAAGLREVRLHGNVKKVGYNAFYGCTALTKIVVDEENPYFASEEGVLYNKAGTAILCYPAGREKTYYEVPEGVKRIGKTAFAFARNLTGVILPDGVESVGEYAFYRCDNLSYAYVPTKDLNAYRGVFPPACVVTDK